MYLHGLHGDVGNLQPYSYYRFIRADNCLIQVRRCMTRVLIAYAYGACCSARSHLLCVCVCVCACFNVNNLGQSTVMSECLVDVVLPPATGHEAVAAATAVLLMCADGRNSGRIN